jgi:hypothetical protein
VIDRIEDPRFRVVLGPQTPPRSLNDVPASAHRALLKLPGCSIGPELSLSPLDDLGRKLLRPEQLAVIGTGIPTPRGHAKSPLVELHRQANMDKVVAAIGDVVPCDVPIIADAA